MSDQKTKACAECRFYQNKSTMYIPRQYMCSRDNLNGVNIITGYNSASSFCLEERSDTGECGFEGKFHSPYTEDEIKEDKEMFFAELNKPFKLTIENRFCLIAYIFVMIALVAIAVVSNYYYYKWLL